MTCEELRRRLDAHLDGELDVAGSLDVQEHLTFCMPCQWAYAKERELRLLLKTRLPRVTAPSALRGRVQAAIRAADRRAKGSPVSRVVHWAAVPVSAAALVLLGLMFGLRGSPSPSAALLVSELAAKHRTYSGLEAPAEISSSSQDRVASWLKQRVHFEVAVPDFSPAGIRLVGARLSDLDERQVAYLLYQKDGDLVSLFGFPRRGLSPPAEGEIHVGDSRFYATRVKGDEVVFWTQGDLAYALVSRLSRETLLECALTVRRLVGNDAPRGA
ncbi:MAG: anti-sigma factor family protein [Candidatus Methylomirabilia bacterium]